MELNDQVTEEIDQILATKFKQKTSVHKYGDYPCDYDHCDYVATSSVIDYLIFNLPV